MLLSIYSYSLLSFIYKSFGLVKIVIINHFLIIYSPTYIGEHPEVFKTKGILSLIDNNLIEISKF